MLLAIKLHLEMAATSSSHAMLHIQFDVDMLQMLATVASYIFFMVNALRMQNSLFSHIL